MLETAKTIQKEKNNNKTTNHRKNNNNENMQLLNTRQLVLT